MINKDNKQTDLKEKTKRIKRALLTEIGPLHIDEKYKKPGMVRRIVNADKPGRIAFLEKLGYRIVTDDTKIGDSSKIKPSSLDSCVRVELGNDVRHVDGILMEIPEDEYNEIQAIKEERNELHDQALGKTGVETQYGEITIGKKTIK